MTLVVKPGADGNFDKRQLAFDDFPTGEFDSLLTNDIADGAGIVVAKLARQSNRMNVNRMRQRAER